MVVVGYAAADARSTGGESGREVVKEKVAENESENKITGKNTVPSPLVRRYRIQWNPTKSFMSGRI